MFSYVTMNGAINESFIICELNAIAKLAGDIPLFSPY